MIEPPNLNTGAEWSEIDICDLVWCIRSQEPLSLAAVFLCRTQGEVREKARELGHSWPG